MMENNLLEILFPKLHSTCLCDTGWSSSDTEVIESAMQAAEPSPDNLLEVFFPKMYRPYMCDSGRSSSSVQASASVMAVADSSPFGIGLKNWVAAEEAAREIVQRVHPTSASEERRSSVTNFVQRLIRDHLGLVVLPFGSVPLKTYIPDGDMDFTAFCGGSEDVLAGKFKAVLQEAERNVTSEFVVKDVRLIPAEVKLVKCTIQNIVVDISFNQIGGVSTLCFLEQIDRLIGKDHLFKRSIMLIKSWSYYESRILGAQHRLISTYALETMVLHVFNLYHSTLNGPLAVLVKFLDYFSKFDWGTFCVSLNGPVCLASLPDIIIEMPEDADGDLLLGSDLLRFWFDMFSVPSRGRDINSRGFQKKHLNIIDPLKLVNNLGRSVNKGNFYRIRSAFTYGAKRLSWILSQPENSIAGELNKFFSNTVAWQETRCRPDVSPVGSRSCKIDNSAHENYKHTSFRNFGSPLCGVSGGLLSKGFEASQKQDGNSNLTPSRILFHYDRDLLIDLSGDFDLYFEWLRYGQCYNDNTLHLHASHVLSSPTALYQNCKLQFQQQDFPCHSHDDFCASTPVRAMQNMIKSDEVFGREDIQLDQGTTAYISGLDQFQNMITPKETYPPSSTCTMIIRKEASSPGSPCIYKPNIIFEQPGMLVRSSLKPSLLHNLFVENKKLGFCYSSPLPFAGGKGCPFNNDLIYQSNGIADFGSVENASRMYVS